MTESAFRAASSKACEALCFPCARKAPRHRPPRRTNDWMWKSQSCSTEPSEIFQNRQSGALTFFRMKLHAHDILASRAGAERRAVIAGRQQICFVLRIREKAVHEINIRSGGNPREQAVSGAASRIRQRVPANLWNLLPGFESNAVPLKRRTLPLRRPSPPTPGDSSLPSKTSASPRKFPAAACLPSLHPTVSRQSRARPNASYIHRTRPRRAIPACAHSTDLADRASARHPAPDAETLFRRCADCRPHNR